MATNSLVANSPFKDLSTREGALSNGRNVEASSVIHERRTPNRAYGQVPKTASGSANTPKSAIGLGIGTASRFAAGAAVTGTRKVSNERKVSIERSANRVASLERKVSGSKENETPPEKPKRAPRKSLAYKALVKGEYVTNSPFLSERRENPAESDAESAGEEETLASPPQRRTSGTNKRNASPSANLSQARTSDSPSASPQRRVSGTVTPSPLRHDRAELGVDAIPPAQPSPTPTKSALSASRRLLGPRTRGCDSPSRKTVTFQTVPDVKEFVPHSREVSLDNFGFSNFDLDGDDEEWTDADGDDWVGQLVQTADTSSPQRSDREMSHDSEDTPHVGDTSATADFMDSLMDDGFLSPPRAETEAFEDQAEFELPMEASFTSFEMPLEDSPARNSQSDDNTESVSSQGAVLSTPLIEQLLLPQSPHHVHTITPHLDPGVQPNLPHSDDHSMLLNGDAAQPAAGKPHPASPGPHSHQEGGLYDPFITIQTATELNGEHHERSEDGVPLGRTSHPDRGNAARALAVQSALGRGFPSHPPRSGPPVSASTTSGSESDSPYSAPALLPAHPSDDVFGAVIASPAARKVSPASPAPPRKVSDRKVSDVPELQGPSKRMAMFKRTKETTPKPSGKDLPPSPVEEEEAAAATAPLTPRRVLPRPPLPPPAALDLPSPVHMVASQPESESENEDDDETGTAETSATEIAEVHTAHRADLSGFSLPDIGVSPLIADDPVFKSESPEKRQASVSPIKRRVSLSAPRLSLPSEIEDEEPERDPTHPASAHPRVSDVAPKLDLSPELEDQAVLADEDEDEVEMQSEVEEPLTPPPVKRDESETRKESPRIPSFEFAGLSLDMPKDENEVVEEEPDSPKFSTPIGTPGPVTITSPSPAPSTPTRPSIMDRGSPVGSPSRMTPSRSPAGLATPSRATPSRVSMSSPLASAPVRSSAEIPTSSSDEFGPPVESNKDVSEMSTTSRVRQRISRELIREQVSKRVAAETATGGRPVSMMDSPSRVISPIKINAPRNVSQSVTPSSQSPLTSPTSGRVSFDAPSPAFRRPHRSSATSIDKDLPAPPAGGAQLDRVLSPDTPTRSSMSSSSSQATALQQLKDGGRDSPKSALDRIMTAFGKDDPSSSSSRVIESPTKAVPPVSILRKQPDVEPPLPNSQSGSINETRAGRMMRNSRRRSASTGDASPSKLTPRLTLGLADDNESILDSVRDEIEHIGSTRGYRVRDRGHVRATYTDGIKGSAAGDLETNKAWRPVRRPSDMNEHSRELRAARAREVSEGKSSGTVYVKVLGVESLQLPMPREQTFFCITLDNGIDYIRTPYGVLSEGARVNQEFSLVEHANFEFSLSLDIRRDPHITKLINERNRPQPPMPPPAVVPERTGAQSPAVSVSSGRSHGGGFRALFGTPRKNKHSRTQSTPVVPAPAPAPVVVQPPRPRVDTIAKYFIDSGNTVAKTHIALKPIASQCEAKVLEIRYPMFAMFKGPTLPDGTAPRPQVAKITIQILRLPPLPGLSPEELPGSIDETLRGLKHHKWHEEEYHEGILTQIGGDCRVPRRRMFKLRGASLLAINEVTKREVTSIDMRELKSVVDLNAPKKTNDDDYDPYSARLRSFQLRFRDGEGIVFSADKDEDKAVW